MSVNAKQIKRLEAIVTGQMSKDRHPHLIQGRHMESIYQKGFLAGIERAAMAAESYRVYGWDVASAIRALPTKGG